jgi:hypothetical protein
MDSEPMSRLIRSLHKLTQPPEADRRQPIPSRQFKRHVDSLHRFGFPPLASDNLSISIWLSPMLAAREKKGEIRLASCSNRGQAPKRKERDEPCSRPR